MFKGSGLEINLVLAESRICMCRPPMLNATAADAGAIDYNRAVGDTYQISNIFL